LTKHTAKGILPVTAVIRRPQDPQHLQAKEWKFAEPKDGETPQTDLRERVLIVPMGDKPGDFGKRTHELLHAQLSPTPDKPMDMVTLAAEDGRIESVATSHGIERESVHPPKANHLDELIRSGNRDVALPMSLAYVGSPPEQAQRRAVAKLMADPATPGNMREFAQTIIDHMDWAAGEYAADPSFASTVRVAERTRSMMDNPPQASGQGDGDGKPQDGEGKAGNGDGSGDSKPANAATPAKAMPKPVNAVKAALTAERLAKALGHAGTGDISGKAAPKTAKEISDSANAGMAPMTKGRGPRAGEASNPMGGNAALDSRETGVKDMTIPVDVSDIMPDLKADSGLKWSTPEIQRPALTEKIVSRMPGHKRSRASDHGSMPTRMARITVDGKVFAGRKHQAQGTVLVDMSGSMSLSPSDIERLVTSAPASVIAGYWNSSGTRKGRIRILAAGGRRVSRSGMHTDGSGNGTDGPAIAWLAKQRGPRIWVSDEYMTANAIYGGEEGVDKDSDMGKQVYDIIRKARIKIVPEPMDAIKHLR
jgi:hypothetical protein